MDNQKKLELTLCGMFSYKLKIQCDNTIWTLDKLDRPYKTNDKLFLNIGCRYDEKGFPLTQKSFISGKHEFKPLLHSLDKLTEPILDGGLIPIVELFKMRTQNIKGDINAVYQGENQTAVLRLNPIKIPNTNIWHQDFFEIDYDDGNICFSLATEIHKFDELEESFAFIGNEFSMLEKLKEWHFNIYDLPKEMYIEKSEVK